MEKHAEHMTKTDHKGILLENLTWGEAEKVLKPDTVVVLPIGAATKEHGPHLKLKNDFLIAEFFKNEVVKRADVVMLPTLNYHFYPAFVEYPGSVTLSFETSQNLVMDICKSLAKFGPKKFYVLNTGVSTVRPLKAAQEALQKEGITMTYSNLSDILGPTERAIAKQEGGTHADEIETSMMMVIAPETVDMKKAVKDYHLGEGPLTRDPKGKGTYSASGIWGDATLATKEKGQKVVDAYLQGLLADISSLQKQ